MIKIYPYEELGHHDYGWLDARYHFSFGEYHNPARMGFGPLRVINDDIVQPGRGFDTHGHANMEIITYVREGAITHKDSEGNEGRTEAGNVQVMSAGTGIRHSEYNNEDTHTNMFQIWIEPREQNVTPRWDARDFPNAPANDSLPLLVSGNPADKDSGALYIHANARIYGGRLAVDQTLSHAINKNAYLLVSQGAITLNDQTLKKGDGAEIIEEPNATITASEDAEIVLIELE